MAHFQAVCKAIGINKLKNQLVQEKLDAVRLEEGGAPVLTLAQRYRHCFVDLRLRAKRCCSLSETGRLYRFCFKCKHEGSFENFVLKSVLGFAGGFLMTYVVFMFFVVQLNFKLSTATLMCSVLGTILIIGLAFSSFVRCIVFLTLPQFFSKRGRQALLAYAFILAVTGPAKNTLNNMGILSESLACGQEQLKAAVRQIVDVIKKPFYAIKDAIKTVVKTVKMIVKKIKEILLKIKRIIMAILRVIKSAFQFLAKILNICNKELGTPFERCSRVFENAITDCNAKLGPLFNWLCSITYLVKSVCYIVKVFDFVCMLVDFIKDSIIGVVVKKVKNFVRHIRTMFYVRIKFSHSFHFQTNASKTYSEVASGIVTEIKQRAQGFMVIFDFISLATSFFFVFLIVKVMHYRYKFLTSERFDNHYISRDFRIIDLQRAKFGKETVLPLNHREKTMYVNLSSMKLVKSEKRKLSKSAVALLVATVKLGSHMVTDYSLYWVLNMINYHGRFQSKVQAPNIPKLDIQGQGLLADLLKAVVKAFQPLGIQIEIDTVPCLPNPLPPDYDRYIQIVSLLVLCWILTLLEPYGLRFRHWIMCYYHPVRARERSVWLYNHIMRSRMSFLKLARRILRRKVLGQTHLTKITCKEFIRSKLKCGFCTICFGPDKQVVCLLCGEVFRESDPKKPIRCSTPGCPGIYCEQCFGDLQNLCTVCLSPIDYGDLSDFSEEKGSTDSDEEDYKKARRSIDANGGKPDGDQSEGRGSFGEGGGSASSAGRAQGGINETASRITNQPGSKTSQHFDTSRHGRAAFSRATLQAASRTSQPFDAAPEPPTGPSPDGTTNEDEIKLLYKSPEDTSDEDASDSSGYSYDYQYEKPTELPAIERSNTRSFRDVEGQRVRDYASMSSFREEIEDAPSVFSNILTRRRKSGEESLPLLADQATMTWSRRDATTSMTDFLYKD